MKIYTLSALAFLFSINAFATARSFRVNDGEITSDGFAVGWGIPGTNLDFEALDKDQKAVDSLPDNPNVHNFLVDVETDEILLDLSKDEGRMDFTVGGYRYGNLFHYGIQSLAIQGLPQGAFAVALTKSTNFDNTIATVILLQRSATGDTKVIGQFDHFQDTVDAAIESHLSAAHKQFYAKAALDVTMNRDLFTGTVDKVQYIDSPMNELTIDANKVRSAEPGILIRAQLVLQMVSGQIQAHVANMTVSRD